MTFRSVKSAIACAWTGRQVGIEDQHVGVELHRADQHLLQLAAADQVLRIGLGAALLHHAHHAHAGGAAQLPQLVDRGPPSAVAASARRARHAAVRRRTSTTTSSARSRLSVATAAGATRSNSSSSASISAAAIERRCGGTARSAARARAGPPSTGGSRCATCRSAGRPSGQHADRRHQVQPQQRQVDEVVARQRLVAQVGVHQAQAAEAAAAGADAADLGQVDARGVADEDVLDLAAPADQDADLALDLARDARTGTPPARPRRPPRPEPPPVHALERVLLARLEPDDVPGDGVQARVPSIRGKTSAARPASLVPMPSVEAPGRQDASSGPS